MEELAFLDGDLSPSGARQALEQMRAREQEATLRRQKLQDMEVPVGPYQVQVNIIEVRDLPEKDDNGTVDPIVFVNSYVVAGFFIGMLHDICIRN